ncbi:MAG: trypsin-like peptidase domain-containing protein [Clostridia bacterium]
MKNKFFALCMLLIVACGFAACDFGGNYTSQNSPNGSLVYADAIEIVEGDTLSDVVDKILPACVSITLSNDNEVYLGSGIAVAPGGIIATNYHVISNLVPPTDFSLKVYQNGDMTVGQDATLLWWSSSTDTALIKLNNGDMPFASMSDRTVYYTEGNKLRVLEDVVTIGTPLELSLQNTATKGVVSHLDRLAVADGRLYEDLIQHDSSISPGNSGGALIDSRGNVIGLNTLGRTDTDASGLFYAVPITPIISVLPNVISAVNAGTTYLTPTLGVVGSDKNMNSSEYSEDGFYISQVLDNASLTGKVQIGDVIVAFEKDGVTYSITDRNDIAYTLYRFKKGDELKVIVKRGALVVSDVEITFSITSEGNN